MTNKELKPCPFCGSKPHRSGTLITCSNRDCFADMNDNRIGQFDPTYVIENWNRRPSSGDARVLDELEKWLVEVREVAKEAAELLDKFSTYFAHAEKREPRKEAEAMADRLEACLSVPAPQTSAERDYTPEEALAEAKRRWGPNAQAIFLPYEQPGPYRVMVKTWPNKDQFWWSEKSFRAAFAETDKAPKTGGDK